MTHPTIEAASQAALRAYADSDDNELAGMVRISMLNAVARVILSAPPSDAEMEAAWNAIRSHKEQDANSVLRAAIIAARAKRLEELEEK